ncbi:hypothetical protein ILUMI_02945 [Ignelater luminosus]|uniref:Uncharacterized protein n=1 Tax=Ignelater luminosus TaxID=2038154 RepID=A0A8K0DCI3_IGNLU|nr:hypothetical protein ILUMI_02945 [Ignelater luminosus]
MNTTKMGYMIKIAGVTKYDTKLKIEDIKDSLKQKPIIRKIENKQLMWYEHIMRTEQKKSVKKVLEVKGRKVEPERLRKKNRRRILEKVNAGQNPTLGSRR